DVVRFLQLHLVDEGSRFLFLGWSLSGRTVNHPRRNHNCQEQYPFRKPYRKHDVSFLSLAWLARPGLSAIRPADNLQFRNLLEITHILSHQSQSMLQYRCRDAQIGPADL